MSQLNFLDLACRAKAHAQILEYKSKMKLQKRTGNFSITKLLFL